jgi:Na+/H+ antiporter NhaB
VFFRIEATVAFHIYLSYGRIVSTAFPINIFLHFCVPLFRSGALRPRASRGPG